MIHPTPRFVARWWTNPITARGLEHCLLLSGQDGACATLLPPLWSLIFEARIALIFPALAALTLRYLWPMAALALAVSLTGDARAWSVAPAAWPMAADGVGPGLLLTAHFGALFVFGILLASHIGAITHWARTCPAPRLIALQSAGCLLMVLPSDTARGFGAALVIALASGAPLLIQLLAIRPLRWLGRVSFSLYLIHVPVLLAFVHGFGRAPLGMLGLIAAASVALLAAEAFYRLVERTSMVLSRRLVPATRRLSPFTPVS
jgi:peptidoglycan/LPS O-acetylase OafA/YrhL